MSGNEPPRNIASKAQASAEMRVKNESISFGKGCFDVSLLTRAFTPLSMLYLVGQSIVLQCEIFSLETLLITNQTPNVWWWNNSR